MAAKPVDDTPTSEKTKNDQNYHLSDLNDKATDLAVVDIMRKDTDEVIASEDSKHLQPTKHTWYKRIIANKKFTVPLAVFLILTILLTLPTTRYKLLGQFWQQKYVVQVIDAQ